ncbi:NAD synthase superfamily protein [Centipeda periodontii DSM 2778]|uniref:Glutamine-dependent NAD(+) synthetase n=1 Tax=Centipeda periodontii DSM 2778 TaxID=888060 RepID=F5RL22_9FIRM|nr:NAD(+) synthase [Centipeda periodontii]EGK60751.1 NAD synthase superfamily protein [Centipeda periodontii DSM 2778]
MKIALISMEVVPGRPDRNAATMRGKIAEAKAAGADLALFPALSLSGLFLGGVWKQPAFLRDCAAYAEEIAAAADGITVVFGNAAEAEICTDVRRTLMEARDGVLCEVAHSPLHGAGNQFAPLLYEMPNENIILAADASPFPICFGASALAKTAHEKRKNIFYINTLGLQDKGKTVYAFPGRAYVFSAAGERVTMSPAYTEGITVVDTDALPVPILSHAEPPIAPIHRMLRYAVQKFLARIHMERVVIGISGGIDSAVAAALYVDAIGAENVLLINMPSQFNSATTKGLAAQLADNLGCRHMIVPIEESVAHTVTQLTEIPIMGKPAAEGEHLTISSFVRENIQARDRSGRVLSTVAAAWGAGFTCNANKAESTVGYATLYGDQAGFLSALADLWKYQVYDLARYLNEAVYGREVIPQGIIDIVPSAELSDAQNVDEGKGDPIRYPYHDHLFRAFAENNETPEDILAHYAEGNLDAHIGCEHGLVGTYFPTTADFIADLERWWRLYTGMAVAKRIQSPPLLSVTGRAYGSDHPESQIGAYETIAYRTLKEKLLKK